MKPLEMAEAINSHLQDVEESINEKIKAGEKIELLGDEILEGEIRAIEEATGGKVITHYSWPLSYHEYGTTLAREVDETAFLVRMGKELFLVNIEETTETTPRGTEIHLSTVHIARVNYRDPFELASVLCFHFGGNPDVVEDIREKAGDLVPEEVLKQAVKINEELC